MDRPMPEKILQWIIVPLMLGLIAIGFAAVSGRLIFGGRYALFWSEEVIRYGFIWLFWLCAPLLVWRGSMFGVDVFTGALPVMIKAMVHIVVNLLIMFLMLFYIYFGWSMAVVNINQSSSALEFPLAAIYAAIPLGSALILLAIAIRTAQVVRDLVTAGPR